MIEVLVNIFDLASPWGVFWSGSLLVVMAVFVLWIVGMFQGNHSMMDGFWGFIIAGFGWYSYYLIKPASVFGALLIFLVSLHGCRLGYYLFVRWLGFRRTTGGDGRYLGWRQTMAKGYWWRSLFIIMEPQALVIMVLILPILFGMYATQSSTEPMNALTIVGLLVFGIGYYWETLADGQLQAFKADKNNKGRYLRSGVWKFTRHPNYFGNVLVWWGIYIVAVSGNPEIWWTIVTPVFNHIMMSMILGSALQDKVMGDRPDYQKVMAETNAFYPRLSEFFK